MIVLGKKIDKKFIITNAPIVGVFYFMNKISWLYRITDGDDTVKLQAVTNNLADAFKPPWPSFNIRDLITGLVVVAIIKFYLSEKRKNAKKFRHGSEYGSARWGTSEDIKPYMSENMRDNIILTETEGLNMKNPKPAFSRNKNVLVIGGSGSGKTRFFIKPNLMQLHSSYIVTDPKGTVAIETGTLLKKNNYVIKVFNTINFSKSNRYNPFMYINPKKPQQSIMSLVNTIIINTNGEGAKATEDFWVKAERLLLISYISYIYYELPKEEKNFSTLLDMIDESECREEDENFKNAIDILFEKLKEKKPNHYAVKQYRKYKLAAGKTAKSIMISVAARLAPFDIKELRDLTSTDEMELDLVGDRKTALFIIISDTDATFNFLVSIMYTQLFTILCEKADDKYGGRLPVHVRCLIDEFANIGQIPNFDKLIATIRSREISAAIVLQAKSQLKAIYKDNADTIEGNCDTMLFLGGSEKTTLKEISEMLGKETIDLYNTSESKGQSSSSSLSYQKVGKELMSQDELGVMNGGKCILRVRGVRPFFSNKYDITKHPNYKYLKDFNEKYAFDLEKHVRSSFRDGTRLKLSPETKLNVVDVGTIGDEEVLSRDNDLREISI